MDDYGLGQAPLPSKSFLRADYGCGDGAEKEDDRKNMRMSAIATMPMSSITAKNMRSDNRISDKDSA